MKLIRIATAALLALCGVPVASLAAAWASAAAGGCALQFEVPNACSFGAIATGPLLDALVGLGVWGALTAGLGAYVFAGWVLLELAAITLGAIGRN